MTSVSVARERLAHATAALAEALHDAQHDLWQDDKLNVAPTQIAATRRLRAKGVENFTAEDLDYAMFKVMTTMGGESSFKFFLPRFIGAVLTFPTLGGWMTKSHVLLSKLELIDLGAWAKPKQEALLAALDAFARFERSIAIDLSLKEGTACPDPDEGVQDLIEFVRMRRECR